MNMQQLRLLDEKLQHTPNRLVRFALVLEALYPNSIANRQNAFQFTVKSGKQEETVIYAKELEYVHSKGNAHTYYGRSQGESYTIVHSGHMKLVYELLHPLGFELAHESWLVNILLVKKFKKVERDHYFLQMRSSAVIPISRNQWPVMRDLLPEAELFCKPKQHVEPAVQDI